MVEIAVSNFSGNHVMELSQSNCKTVARTDTQFTRGNHNNRNQYQFHPDRSRAPYNRNNRSLHLLRHRLTNTIIT